MVTGGIDLSSYMEYEELQGLPQVPTVVFTDYTHIFSKSMDAGIQEEQNASILFRLSGPPLTYARGHTRRTPGQSFANLDITMLLMNLAAQPVTFIEYRTL